MLSELYMRVTGRVQGVGFRAFVQKHAVTLGLTGIARNLADGAVEIIAQGSEENLQRLAAYVHSGPRRAHVDSVRTVWSTPKREYQGFHIR